MPFSFNSSQSKYYRWFSVIICILVMIRCIWLWQPKRQVLLHQRHFLDAVQNQKWTRMGDFFSETYRDRLGHDKVWTLRESREILRQFFAMSVLDSQTRIMPRSANSGPDTARVQTTLHIDGTGTPIAEYAKDAVNGSDKPFEFTWKQESWRPWDWRLISADHPIIERVNGEM